MGDVDPAQVQLLAERYFGSWRPSAAAITLNQNIQQLAAEPLPQPMSVVAAARSGNPNPGGRVAAAAAYAGPGAAAAAVVNHTSGGSLIGSMVGDEFVQKSAAGPLLTMAYYRPSITGKVGTALEVSRYCLYVCVK